MPTDQDLATAHVQLDPIDPPDDSDTDPDTDPDTDGQPTAPVQISFAELGVQPQIVAALAAVGITYAFPIQAMTLPVALTGHDIIGQAKTGTGKTLGFGIPVLQQVKGPGEPGFDQLLDPGKPQALVVVPTRELAVQVAGDINAAAAQRAARVLTVYGGRAYEPQVEALRKGIEIVVGTPGRLLDLAQQGHLTLGHARIVVLDEADEMLDLGFLPDVERLLAQTPDGRQMMLFSATMPGAVVALARRYMTQPTHIRAADPDDTGATVKATKQFAYRAHALDKVEMLARMLQAQGRGLTMIFARTKRSVAKVADDLAVRGFASAAIHGDLGQGAREQALRAFRNGKVDVLVATDVAARGIDVDDVTHVVNYQCPEDEKTYLHRIGRTGRAGKIGVAVTFVDWDDLHRWAMIDRTLGLGMGDPVETYSSSEHFFADLGIPAGTRGTLPRGSRTRAGLDAEEVEDLGETGRGPRGAGRSGPAASGKRSPGRAGAKGDGPRGSGRDRAADSSDPNADAPAADGEATRPRRTRERRRTRGGQPLHGSGGTSARDSTGDEPTVAAATAGSGEVSGTAVAPTAAITPGPDAEGAPRRRRRRGGRGRGARVGVDAASDAGDSTGA